MRKLRICQISDTHGEHDELSIPECDVLICSGDVSMMGWRHEMESFLRWLKLQAQCTYKIWTGGNHDLSLDPQRGGNDGEKPDWLIDLILQCKKYNIIYLENESVEIMGVKFWGSPTSAWFLGHQWAFNVKEEDSERIYSTIPHDTDIVITHGPAYTYGDWCKQVNGPVGDHILSKHIKRVKPLIHMFGHIHESYGWELGAGGVFFFNGCNTGLDYYIKNKPWLIEVDFDEKEVEILNQNT